MTNQPQQPQQAQHPVDPGNPFVMGIELPGALGVAQIMTSNGARLLVTVRSGGTTLTLLLNKTDATAWGAAITRAASELTSLIVPVAGPLPPLANGQMN